MDRYYDDGQPKPQVCVTLMLTAEDAEEILTGLCWRVQQIGLGAMQYREIGQLGTEVCAEFAERGLVMEGAFKQMTEYPRKISVRKS